MRIGPQRPINAEAVVAPDGYRVEALVTGVSFPTAVSFGPGGELYLSEGGGVAGSVVGVPRVLRIDPDQSVNEIGRLENPIVGLAYRNGELLIAEDGDAPRILRVTAEGELKVLVGGLPGGGDYGLSGLTLDRSGAVVFGLGTRTNSGVVGLDNVARGWVARNPEWADVPGADVELEGVNYVTSHPTARGTARSTTGAFKPFGRRSEAGETVRGQNLCGGAVFRVSTEGEPERVAWGFRNPVGIGLGPDGRLWATEGGMEERGSRPIAGAPDSLWEVQVGGYYGWPDFAAGLPVTESRFRLPGHPQPRRLLDRTPRVSGTPGAVFPARAGVGRVDFSISEAFGFAGEAFVALSGPWSTPAYLAEEEIIGHRVVRVDTRTGAIRDFLVNRQVGPSSATNGGGLERPFDIRFDPTGEVLYVVDMGEVQLTRENGLEPYGGTGVVWRITRIRTISSGRGRSRGAAAQAEPAPEDAEQPEVEAAGEAPVGLEAAAEIEAAGESLDLEPPASDWLSDETPSLELDEQPDEPAWDEPSGAEDADEAAAMEAVLPEPEAAEPTGDAPVGTEEAVAPEDTAGEEAAPEEAGEPGVDENKDEEA
jgi:glucose/arabinose dehydrogenase